MRLSRMQTWAILALAALFFGFTLFHASWIAGVPPGRPKLLAASGAQLVTDDRGCIVDAQAGYGAIDTPSDVRMLQAASGSGAQAVNIPVEINGAVAIIARTGKTKCAADMARPRALLSQAPPALTNAELFVRIDTPADVPAILAAIPAAGKPVFYGSDGAMAAVRKARPDGYAFAIAKARQCTSDYKSSGWMGSVPASCKNGTALVTLDELGFTLWGWPNRYLARMQASGTRVIIAQDVKGDAITGLTTPERYGDIADSFNGTIWVEDIANMGPALKP
jgi:hypothetical protein